MRNTTLHGVIEAFTTEAAGQLEAETAAGAEVPFELVDTASGPRRPGGRAGERGGGRVPLYCYRPLTGTFIRERLGLLSALPSYAAAVRALSGLDGVETYVRQRGEARVPADPRESADAALRAFLTAVFAERSEFGFDFERFEAAYGELERALYDGRSVTSVAAPLLGVALDSETREMAIAEGLSLVPGDLLDDLPSEAVWGDGEEPNVLIVLTAPADRDAPAPVSVARVRFRRMLTALRLFERGGYALGPIAWTRVDTGAWRAVPLGGSGRPRMVRRIAAAQEDELRAFCNLVARRAPHNGEISWALARFEMGCERLAPFEALTDYLLALRALLEPEGPASGRLAGRIAAICATPDDRAAMTERVAHAISLERAVIGGLAPAHPGVDALVDELAEQLRALLRDVLCGHLGSDLCALADDLLAEAAEASADRPPGRESGRETFA
ncbi:MAG TPA: hypothetical protein VME22_06500 [Solirubrobacteraceae bacterium]|nr:hypothetical protein [Solirubrobacteraceae bacterium]